MSQRFCPSCGRTVDKLYDNLCRDCFLKKFSFVNLIPGRVIIKRCKNCGRIFYNNKNFDSVEGALESLLANLLKRPEIGNATYRLHGNRIHVTLNLKFEDLEKSEEKVSDLVFKNIVCKSCSMKISGYFQAILQVRSRKELMGKISKDVEDQLSLLNQKDGLAFISKIEKIKNGFDYYIGSRRSALEIAKHLKNKFKGNIKVSRKLSGSISGKKVYRDTILVSIGE